MKRYGNLYPAITCRENIEKAIDNASKGKKRYKEVIEVLEDRKTYVDKLHKMLSEKSYTPSEYSSFIKNDSGKERKILRLPFFPDRIIQHAILQILEPIWKSSLIAQTYQSIRGRGVHKCLKEVKKAVQVEKIPYCLQLDIKKFYPSIDNTILKRTLRKKVKCKDTLALLDKIVDSTEGVPIGNYISQYFANLVLSDLDHKIKEVLRCKYYYRYCDDLLLMSADKQYLWECMVYIKAYLEGIKLTVKDNHQLYKITESRGVGCFGYIVTPNKTLLRKNIVTAFKRKVQTGKSTVSTLSAYRGWFKHCDACKLWNSLQRRAHVK